MSAVVTLVVLAAAAYAAYVMGGVVGMALGGAAGVLAVVRFAIWILRISQRPPDLSAIDAMDGLDFEECVADLLRRQGWAVQVTAGSHDLGVDLIAERKYERLAVQVKRQELPVSRRAVSDAVAGREHYDCDGAMVVTNNYFTRGAEALAESTGCELVDRDELGDWIAGRIRR